MGAFMSCNSNHWCATFVLCNSYFASKGGEGEDRGLSSIDYGKDFLIFGWLWRVFKLMKQPGAVYGPLNFTRNIIHYLKGNGLSSRARSHQGSQQFDLFTFSQIFQAHIFQWCDADPQSLPCLYVYISYPFQQELAAIWHREGVREYSHETIMLSASNILYLAEMDLHYNWETWVQGQTVI